MTFKGPSATFETTAPSTSEQKIASIEKKAACCSFGVSSLRRKTVETPTRTLPKACLSNSSPMLTS